MLVSEFRALAIDPISAMIGQANGNNETPRELQTGVYKRPDFGSSDFLRGAYEQYPENLSVDCYGVCDTPEQLIEKCPELTVKGREFVVTVTPVIKSNQPSDGGWRWHKWGDYIGDKSPQCEYLYDEPEIEDIWIYHIYEKI